VRYRLATGVPAFDDAEGASAESWLPRVALRNGQLAMERGLHQELGWERRTGNSDVEVVVFADHLKNPILEAAQRRDAGEAETAVLSEQLLYDSASGLVRAAGPAYTTSGVVATVGHRIPGGGQARLSYANGGALMLASSPQPAGQPLSLAQLLASAHVRRAQTCTISLSGTLDGSGTRWRATYRWQPEDTVSPVASFARNAVDPYLNFQIRQPLRFRRASSDGPGSIEALFDLRNLLSQGYRPYLLSDGSMLVFAQGQRGISGGLAFNF
jgi:hypothetical protein